MLGYLLWLLVGVGIGVYAAPTASEAKAQLLRRLRDLEGVAPWLDADPTDGDEERR
jgi:prefoldin subunit 5